MTSSPAGASGLEYALSYATIRSFKDHLLTVSSNELSILPRDDTEPVV